MKIQSTIALFLITVAITSQVPQAFNYTAVVRDSKGALVQNKDVLIKTSIIQGTYNGSIVFEENHYDTTSSAGLISIHIGNGHIIEGEFDSINWANGPFFVNIKIDIGNFGTFIDLGTTQLLSVPYALYADKCNQLDNSEIQKSIWYSNGFDIYYNKGNVGIGKTDPQNALSIEGDETEWPGRIFFSINNKSISNKSLAYMEIKAGSGTNHTVLGHISETYTANDNPEDLQDFGILSSNGKGIIIGAMKNDLNPGIIKFCSGQSPGTRFIERMRIAENGNIGIGTASPNSKLQVTDGDIYIENIEKGVIMKSPDGNCWRLTVENDGSLKTTAVSCP